MTSREAVSVGGVAIGRGAMRVTGTIALVALLVLGVFASPASAEPLSMTFTEGRASVGDQLTDDSLFGPPKTAPLETQIDSGGSIMGGFLAVPQFLSSSLPSSTRSLPT